MRAPDDVKQALEAIGFEAEDIVPKDDPSYTEFRRGPEMFSICHGVEGKAISIQDAFGEMQKRITTFVHEDQDPTDFLNLLAQAQKQDDELP